MKTMELVNGVKVVSKSGKEFNVVSVSDTEVTIVSIDTNKEKTIKISTLKKNYIVAKEEAASEGNDVAACIETRKDDDKMVDRDDKAREKENIAEIVKEQLTMLANGKINCTNENGVHVGRYITIGMVNAMRIYTKEWTNEHTEEIEELINKAIEVTYRKSYKNCADIEKFFKDANVITTISVLVSGAQTSTGSMVDENNKAERKAKKFSLSYETRLESMLESGIERSGCKVYNGTLADSGYSYTGLVSTDVISVGIDNKKDLNDKRIVESFCDVIDEGSNLCPKNPKKDKYIYLVLRKSGLSKAFDNLKDVELNSTSDDEIFRYVYCLDTPSSQKKGSVKAFKMESYKNKDGKIVSIEKRDIRIKVVDKSLDGGLSKAFLDKDGNWVFYETKESLYKKYKTRLGLGATSSLDLGVMDNYAVFEDVSCHAGYNMNDPLHQCNIEEKYTKKIDEIKNNNALSNAAKKLAFEEIEEAFVKEASDMGYIFCRGTKDGSVLTSAQWAKEQLKKRGLNVDLNSVLSICLQVRGGGNKAATKMVDKNYMVLVFNRLYTQDKSNLLYIVLDGKRIDAKDVTKKDIEELLKKINGIFDANAMKILDHDATFKLVAMKKAHITDSGFNMVMALVSLLANNKETIDLIERRAKEQIKELVKQLGVKFILSDDGSIDDIVIDYSSIQGVNSIAQDVDWIRNCIPQIMDAINPGEIKTKIKGVMKQIAKIIEHFRIDMDCKYCVVQSDPGVLFGIQLIKLDEVYDPSCNVNEVALVRHPISTMSAVAVKSTVSRLTLLKRLARTNLHKDEKEAIRHYLMAIEGFIIMPASEYEQEKFDGYDFDIDAFQEFRDQELVNILKKIPEIGTHINRKEDQKLGISTSFSKREEKVRAWQDAVNNGLDVRLEDIVEETKEEIYINNKIEKPDDELGETLRFSSKFKAAKISHDKELFDKDSEGRYACSFHNALLLFKEYLLNPVAAIGLIATGNYNNAGAKSFFDDNNVLDSDKEFFSKYLNAYFGGGNDEYVSPIDENSVVDEYGRTNITLCKNTALDILFRYSNSKPTVSNTARFIRDCLSSNRYVGESSIDSAKKMYKVLDYFNFCNIFKSLGSDKNSHVRELINSDENEGVFNKLSSELDPEGKFGAANFFETKFLGVMFNEIMPDKDTYDKNSALCYVKRGAIDDTTCMPIKETIEDNKELAIKDNLFKLKLRLTRYANQIMFLATKRLEAYVTSDEATKIRYELIDKDLHGNKDLEKIIANINSSSITLNSSIHNASDNENEIDDVSEREYVKNNFKSTLYNTAMVSFNGGELKYTKEEIGAVVLNYLINNCVDEKKNICKNSSNTVISVFLEEIVAYINSITMTPESTLDATIQYGEKIQRISINGKNKNFADYVGAKVNVISGKGFIETEDDEIEMVEVSCKNKKACVNGTIEKIDGAFYVAADRETSFKKNNETGIYVAVENKASYNGKVINLKARTVFETYANDENAVDSLSELNPDFLMDYEDVTFNPVFKMGDRTFYNAICVGNNVFCELKTNDELASVLENIDLSSEDLLFFFNGSNAIFHIKNDKLTDKIEEANNIDASINLDKFSENVAPVLSDENDAFDMFANKNNVISSNTQEEEPEMGFTGFSTGVAAIQ